MAGTSLTMNLMRYDAMALGNHDLDFEKPAHRPTQRLFKKTLV